MHKVLYVDGFNLFYSSYYACRVLGENGDPAGGVVGFFKQLRNLTKLYSAKKVVIVFDGPDAGFRRKLALKEYKGKRAKKVRYTNVQMGEEKEDRVEVSNEQEQLQELFELLKLLPVTVLIIPYYEADDIIAYLVQKNKGSENIIISNDKDYLQLVNEQVSVYQTAKKNLIYLDNFKSQYKVSPRNYLFLRTLTGDVSDALSGIKGVGAKTVFKLFPELIEKEINTFEEFWTYLDSKVGKQKALNIIKSNKDNLFLMYRLMILDQSNLSLKAEEVLKNQITTQSNKPFSKINLKFHCKKKNYPLEYHSFEHLVNPFVFLDNKIPIL